jgi:SAM-dependent methyltransferase
MTGLPRKIAAVRASLQAQGWRGFAMRAVDKLRSLISTKDVAWLAHKARVDELFDTKFGLDTRGITQLSGLEIAGPNRPNGVAHIASDPDEFADALASLQIRHEDFIFVDLGSGKGRALLLALRFPFRRIVGVEFALELHRIAQANLVRFAATGGMDTGRISLVHADAAEFELPMEPLVIYLYNPFNAYVMKRVVKRVLDSHTAHPRPIYVIYANAFLENLWLEQGCTVLARGSAFSLIAPP